MGLTKEKLKINVKYSEKYSYMGKKFDAHDIEIIKENIKDEIKDAIYQVLENQSIEQEDLNYFDDDIEVEIEELDE